MFLLLVLSWICGFQSYSSAPWLIFFVILAESLVLQKFDILRTSNLSVFPFMDSTFGISFPGGAVLNNPPAKARDTRDAGSVPGLRRSPGEGNGDPLQCSCLGNPMDRGAWQATVHRVEKSWT